MQNLKNQTQTRRKNSFRRVLAWVLLVAMLVQPLSFTISAAAIGGSPIGGIGSSDKQTVVNGIGKFESEEIIKQLKKDFLGSINQDLISRVDEYELKGDVGVIITFSDNSLIDSYTSSTVSDSMTYGEYLDTSAASALKEKLTGNQNSVLAALERAGLVTAIKYQYCNIVDGAFIRTTYEQLEQICNFEGVERVIISNTYKPAIAVDNPVDVYETGIFNSSDISFTGERTIVAILDTGCDYTHTAFTTHDVVDPLYTRDDIEGFLTDLKAYEYDSTIEAREVYYGNITKNKIAFGYDYADKDTDIMPFSSSHGTHVAGIIGGLDDEITGVAIDTQFAIMKVFSDYETGAEDGDILAALEDSVILKVDAINMSLGSSCGFTREVDEEYKNEIYDKIDAAGISLIVAASNDYSSGYGSEHGNTNKTDNPDSATVGAPSTYDAAFSVASINGNKENYMFVNGDREVFFNESYNMNSKPYDFFELMGISEQNPHAEFEYVTIPGFGYPINYTGLDMTGKIALVSRGDITFEEKMQYAYEAGAVAIIIYNNIFGEIIMTVGNDLKIPAISINRDDGDVLAAQKTGKIVFEYSNEAGPFMSDFSSWGPNPDLTLKPEITAHGGNIYSAIPGGEYEEMSGTSMAAPNMCGIVVLIRQYVKEKYEDFTATQVRDLVNQLCMSTATIAMDMKGHPYSPRKQGAGIADIAKSTTTPAYLYVNADGTGKTKLELGDDPARTGVYEMSVYLKNLSDKSVSYVLGNITMTESISTSDPEFVAEMAYMLSNTASYKAEGGTIANGIVTVEAGATAKITVTLTLSAEDKEYLNSTFANGMYVEGFLTFDNTDENGVDLNAPFLAFYGDWGEAPIFDLDYYEVETEAHNNAIDDDDKIKADYYATTPLGSYYYDYLLPLGCYLWKMDEEAYTPIPAIEEHAAVSYYMDAISGIYGVYAGLLRGAKELNVSIVDTATGEEVWSMTEYNCYKSHFNGAPMPYISRFDLPMVDTKTGEIFGDNNAHYEVTMSAALDWDGDNRNSLDTYSFSFYIDYEAPSVTSAEFRTEYDKAREENRYYVDIYVYDNHYAMSLRPVIIYDFVEEDGEVKKTYASLTEYPIPIYQENRGETTKVTFELTDYIDIIADSGDPQGLTVYLEDYALNPGVAYIPFPDTDSTDLEFMDHDNPLDEITLDIHETLDLTTLLVYEDTTKTLTPDYLKTLTWTSSDESVVAICDGKIEAMKTGTATIRVTGTSWVTKTMVDGEEQEVPLYKTLVVKVSENEIENPNSSKEALIEALDFVSYDTLFAFNSDIDYSEIGLTNTINYFDGNPSISFYPSEKVKLNYKLEPWNLAEDRYTLKWTSSNPKVATVDENGVVTAEAEGSARISLQISIDGKTSLLAARCSVEVKSEFIVENRTLVAYKGKGGDVVIPDDEGIMFIGAFAFCHYNLDNEREVEKDENGYYDIDLKKDPLGNNTVTSVVIPEGVDTIEKYAFYNCKLLNKVVLPETCKTINSYAFANCDVLTNVNFDNVNVIFNYAFYNCSSLTCEDLGGANLAGTYAIGDYAFSGARFDKLTLTNLSLIGTGAFASCSKLETVELGKKTRIAKSMFENTPLKEVVIYSDIISDSAFKGCTSLESVEIVNDITYLGEEAFSGCSKLESVTFGGACEEIARLAFYKCTSLEDFTLPNSEVVIGDGAFGESGLKNLTFAKNSFISNTGISVFDKVNRLNVDVSGSSHYELYNGAIYAHNRATLVMVAPGFTASTFTVPASVVQISDGAFASNIYLTSIDFEEGSRLSLIGDSAFANCISLRSVNLPDNDITIGSAAFLNTSVLKTINLDSVTEIKDFAFQNTGMTSLYLPHDGVVIGEGAFYGSMSLKTITIGAGAVIGNYAFSESNIQSVEFLGGDITVCEGAFAACTKLTDFDFADLSGALGRAAFYGCTALTEVHIPNVTEIGEACFADCYALSSFTAEKLEVVGDYAFAAYIGELEQGAAFKTISAPSLRVIGQYAFSLCLELETIDLSGVTEIGEAAFARCESLASVTLTDSLKAIADYAFYECTALTDIDLSHATHFGFASFLLVPLPAELDLSNAEYIGDQAFIETDDEDKHYIESVYAPNVTYIGEQAFVGCSNLKTVYAPKVVEIALGAFAYTGIEKFEITENLEKIETSVFEGCESFTTFYATVDGEEVDTATFANMMIKEGVLYAVMPKGYVLVSYPAAKTATTFTVADGTVRIGFGAAYGNTYLEKVILPGSVGYIGDGAFNKCENLKTVVFQSYYAPVLEGTMTGETFEITSDVIEDYPGFDKLYKYNYYYMKDGVASPLYLYHNFAGIVTGKDAVGLTYVIPEKSSGYDSVLYKAFFTASEGENSGIVTGPYALAFINAVKKLPAVVDRFNKALVDAAIGAYNALERHEDELAQVDTALIERFHAACSEYNISVVENKINHLFDMYNSEYSFELVKDARASYLALTEEEKKQVDNAATLDEKIAELATAMGKELDFSISYADHFKVEEPDDPGVTPPVVEPKPAVDPIVIVVIAVAAVLLIGAGVVTVILLKKKKAAAQVVEPSEASAVAEETGEDTASDTASEDADGDENAVSDAEAKEE